MSDLKIVSYNIENGRQQEKVVENIQNIAQQGFNVFCLQEVRSTKEGQRFICDVLLEKLGAEWKAETYLSNFPNSDYGLAVLWKASVIENTKFEKISLTKLQYLHYHEQAIEYVQGYPTDPIQRGAMIGTFSLNGKTIRIINIHIDWHGWAYHRARQLEELIKYLKDLPRVEAEVICGDFNTLGFFGFGRRFTKIENLLKEYVSAFPRFQITTTHFQQLDHIFVRNFKINQAEILNLPGSDHYPIVVSLA